MSNEFLASSIGLVLTAIGLIYTGHQIYGSKKIARGDFLLHIDEMFQQHNETHMRLRPGGDWGDGKTGPTNVEEWVALEQYMGLFERINILVEDKIVDVDTIYRLYGYRIINISNNKAIQQTKLEYESDSWQDFIKLRDKIIKMDKVIKIRKERAKLWFRTLKFLRLK